MHIYTLITALQHADWTSIDIHKEMVLLTVLKFDSFLSVLHASSYYKPGWLLPHCSGIPCWEDGTATDDDRLGHGWLDSVSICGGQALRSATGKHFVYQNRMSYTAPDSHFHSISAKGLAVGEASTARIAHNPPSAWAVLSPPTVECPGDAHRGGLLRIPRPEESLLTAPFSLSAHIIIRQL